MADRTVETITVDKFVPYFTTRGLTQVEAVELWDHLEYEDGTDPEGDGITYTWRDTVYAMQFVWLPDGSAGVSITASPQT